MEYLYIIGFSAIVIIGLAIKTSKQATMIEENMNVIERAGIALTMAKKELEGQDKLILEQKKQIEELAKKCDDQKKAMEYFLKSKSQLRRELEKRTEQYNDLVDLAREKGIIGE